MRLVGVRGRTFLQPQNAVEAAELGFPEWDPTQNVEAEEKRASVIVTPRTPDSVVPSGGVDK